MNTPIKYIKGDATLPFGYGTRIIAHVVSYWVDTSGEFFVRLTKRYPLVETHYREWAATECASRSEQFALGNVQFVNVGDDVTVANMLAQQETKVHRGRAPFRYISFHECLVKVRECALATKAAVHAPRIGTGLAGGDWALISDTIRRELSEHGIQVFIYDLMT